MISSVIGRTALATSAAEPSLAGVGPWRRRGPARRAARPPAPSPDLHVLRSELAHVELVLLAKVPVDRQGHLVAGQLAGPMGEDPAEAERRDLGRPTADVDDHVHSPLQRIDATADGACDRLVERRHRADARFLSGLEERTALQRRRADGRPDDCADRPVHARRPAFCTIERKYSRASPGR